MAVETEVGAGVARHALRGVGSGLNRMCQAEIRPVNHRFECIFLRVAVAAGVLIVFVAIITGGRVHLRKLAVTGLPIVAVTVGRKFLGVQVAEGALIHSGNFHFSQMAFVTDAFIGSQETGRHVR